MHFMIKTRQDNDVTHHTGPLYTENETKLSCPIQQGTIYDDDHIRQWRDWSYRDYAEIGTQLSWPIEQHAVYHKNLTEQRRD